MSHRWHLHLGFHTTISIALIWDTLPVPFCLYQLQVTCQYLLCSLPLHFEFGEVPNSEEEVIRLSPSGEMIVPREQMSSTSFLLKSTEEERLFGSLCSYDSFAYVGLEILGWTDEPTGQNTSSFGCVMNRSGSGALTGTGTKWTPFVRSWCHALIITTHFFAPSLHVLFFFLVALPYFLLFLIFCSLTDNILLVCISQINFLTLSWLCWCAIFLHFLLLLSLISTYKCFCFIII